MRILRIVVVTVIAPFSVIAGFMYAGGRTYILGKLSGWHQWAEFNVPSDALPLRAEVKLNPQDVVTCNTGDGPWKHSLCSKFIQLKVPAFSPSKLVYFRDVTIRDSNLLNYFYYRKAALRITSTLDRYLVSHAPSILIR